MSSPIPPVGLQDSCSVVHNNILYVYTSRAFQSLQLSNGTEWTQLKQGVPVTGAACVKGAENGAGSEDALWVVGGSSQDMQYPGLQKYSFTLNSWQTIEPLVKVTQNRRGHAATFLPEKSMILMYAGSQDGVNRPSIQTFGISTTKPYNILSFTARNPPVIAPLLLPWNGTSAITVGGTQGNKAVYLFNPDNDGWHQYDTALPRALKSSDKEKGTLISGSDNSKVLELYDMSVSPNVVERFVLQNAQGQPAQTGRSIGQASSSNSGSNKRKRDLTLANWPTYNSSAAPTYQRTAFSLAQRDDGLAAIAGGNDQHPVALFNQNNNAWVDSSKFFGLQDNTDQSFLGPTSSASPTSTATATATSTPTPPPANNSHPDTSKILGATLGSILGFIALLILALLYIRHRRQQKAKRAREEGGDDEKPRLSFADRGAPFMMEGGSGAQHHDPHSSVAILSGLAGHKRGMSSRGSDSSTTRLVPARNNLGYNEAVEMATIREKGESPLNGNYRPGTSGSALAPPKRSSGWSRYFSGTTDVAAAGARASAAAGTRSPRRSGLSRKSVRSSSLSSTYAQSNHDCSSHGPTEIPPLNLGQQFESTRVSSQITSSPQTSHASSMAIPRSRPMTMSSDLSSNPPSTLGDTIFTSQEIHDDSRRWTPVTRTDWSAGDRRDTATSSIYTTNPRDSEHPARGGPMFSGPVGGSVYPSSNPPRGSALDARAKGPTDSRQTPIQGSNQAVAASQGTSMDGLTKPSSAHFNHQARDSNVSLWPSTTTLPAKSSAASMGGASPLPSPGLPMTNDSLGMMKPPAPGAFHDRSKDSMQSNATVWPEEPKTPVKPSTAVSAADSGFGELARPPVVGGGYETPRGSSETIWPRPGPAHRASIVDPDDESDDEDVIISTAAAAPTAVTAIPVPASTAMQYTVKKPQKVQPTTSDMSWIDLQR